jgi:hypothetical protein
VRRSLPLAAPERTAGLKRSRCTPALALLGYNLRVALWHFSEDPDIRHFEPHVPKPSERDEALVWAIDDWHAPMYFTPRDCPRVCFWAIEGTTAEDRERWTSGLSPRFFMALESTWLDRLRSAKLFRYRMPEAGFVLDDVTAGHHVAREIMKPLAIEPVGDLLSALAAAQVELRITPRLGPLWHRIKESTLEHSGTRLRNAQGYPQEF